MVPEQENPGRRRNRQRTSDAPARPTETASSAPPPVTGSRPDKPRKGRERGGEGRDSDRGWRELAGTSPSQVGVGGALRARDVARPEQADYDAAERDLVIVRRDWKPPTDELPAPVRH